MRTLALHGGERVAVVAAEWRDAFGVVTRGRVRIATPEPGLPHASQHPPYGRYRKMEQRHEQHE